MQGKIYLSRHSKDIKGRKEPGKEFENTFSIESF